MGRRLNTSTPTVIQTMLTPLLDSFSVQENDTLEQWYYVNTGTYSPDRSITPLQLTPTLVAVDPDTSASYSPTFSNVVWYYFDPTNSTDYSSDTAWPGLGWVRITAVEAATGGVLNDYYCPTTSNPNYKLYVQKNVPPADGSSANAGQSICCVATYIDPRDAGVTIMVRDVVLLVTNKDATMTRLSINMLSPTKTIYDPLTSPTSLFDFSVKVLDDDNSDVTSSYYIEWYGKVDNAVSEVLINTLPCYTQATQATGKGQGTDTIKIDAMFVEHLDLVCRIRQTSSSPLLPAVAYSTLVWEFPNIDASTMCNNGRVVNNNVRNMKFDTIVNYRGGVLSDALKAENLVFNYKRRISTSSSYTNMGWGQSITVPSSDLKQSTSYSTPVHSEIYLLGAYQLVMDDGSVVTDNGQNIFDRTL